MRGLFCTALVVAVAGTIVSAELKTNLTGVDFPMEKRHMMCRVSCKVPAWYEMTGQIETAYSNLNQNMTSKELFESICPPMYAQQKCLSNCKNAFNIADNTEPMQVTTKAEAVITKICTGLTEKLSTLDTLTECANKIYPLIAKPEENAKCKKMCCSDPSNTTSLYACFTGIQYESILFFIPGDVPFYVKENNCQLACVVGQAAKHAHNKCSPVLEEMLLIVRQDVQKIYQGMKVEEDQLKLYNALEKDGIERRSARQEEIDSYTRLVEAINIEKSIVIEHATIAALSKNPYYQTPFEDLIIQQFNRIPDVDFPMERKQQLCSTSCNVDYEVHMGLVSPVRSFDHHRIEEYFESVTQNAYHHVVFGLSSKTTYETICPNLYRYHKCMSNCKEAFNIVNATDPDAIIEPNAAITKICTGLTEKLSTLDTLTECTNRIYPLIAKPEENAKCKKMCCSDPSNTESLYTCGVMITQFRRIAFKGYNPFEDAQKESMCQLACVIGQAARHARNECSPVLEEILLVAGQDMQKLYQDFEKKVEENKRRVEVLEKQLLKHEKALNERLYNYKQGNATKTENSNF